MRAGANDESHIQLGTMLSIEQTASTLSERFVASIANDAAVRVDLARLQLASQVQRSELEEALEHMALSLRTDIAILSFVEALHSLGANSTSAVKTLGVKVIERAQRIAGFDVRPLLRTVGASADGPASNPEDLQIDRLRAVVARHVLGRLAAFPAKEVKLLTTQLDDAAIAHQIFQDAQKLEAIARRADDVWAHRLKDAGELFLEGRIEVADVARLWGRPPQDVAAEFERLGFVRSAETIELSDAERRRRLTHVSRSGGANSARIARDVVASQRIEGIDARGHDAVTELSLPDER